MIACPICGGPPGACKGTAPAVRLTPEQLLDIGEINAKEYAAMTERPDHTVPRLDPGLEGAEHGYVGKADEDKFDRAEGGWSNAPEGTPARASKPAKPAKAATDAKRR